MRIFVYTRTTVKAEASLDLNLEWGGGERKIIYIYTHFLEK
jgi:hypothetical protein